MTEELSGRRIVVPETRELGQLLRMLEERGADTVPCPMIAIRDAPDPVPIYAWLRRFAKGACDDLVLMTGEGLRRLLGFARRIDLESAFIDALRLTRKITRGPKPVRALREIGLAADVPADKPTTEGVIAALERTHVAETVAIPSLGGSTRSPPKTERRPLENSFVETTSTRNGPAGLGDFGESV
jgi:uroporphyrinogen-III synthase